MEEDDDNFLQDAPAECRVDFLKKNRQTDILRGSFSIFTDIDKNQGNAAAFILFSQQFYVSNCFLSFCSLAIAFCY